jgi:ATP-dependent DNA helicase RecG
MTHLGVKNRTFFRKNHLDPLLENGILKMSYPDKPKHPKQTYVLTEIGFELKSRLRKKDKGEKE